MLEQEMRFLQHVALREIGHGMAWDGSGILKARVELIIIKLATWG